MQDPTYFGTMMVQEGQADGMVSGAVNTTVHTIRPALELIKTKVGGAVVSSVFFMCLKDRRWCSATAPSTPTPPPRNWPTSPSTPLKPPLCSEWIPAWPCSLTPRAFRQGRRCGQGEGGRGPGQGHGAGLLLDGPLQYDAAIDPAVAAAKMPGNPVAGKATIFIFPDLNTGNNTYKAVQRAAGAEP